MSTDAKTKKNNQTAPSARSSRSSLEWQVQDGQDKHALVEAVVACLEQLRRTERPFIGGATRAVAVQVEEGNTLVTILVFGDAMFEDLALLMRSLELVNVLSAEDPATGLDAVFVPMSAANAAA